MKGINIARAGVAAMSCGMMQSALDHALSSVTARNAFGGTLGDMQGIQWMLADVATDLEGCPTAGSRGRRSFLIAAKTP